MTHPSCSDSSKIHILLVEDSPLEASVIRRALEQEPDLEVVAVAGNGAEALQLIPLLRPDVICTDYHMPVMDGLEFTRQVMEKFPCPILVLSISAQPNQTAKIVEMIEAGAIDVMPKPLAIQGGIVCLDQRKLVERIRILKGVKCIHRRANGQEATNKPASHSAVQVIGIGSSTGGPQALHQILPQLPANLSAPIVCVQHMSSGFMMSMIEWLAQTCRLRLQMAEAGQMPVAGRVYFAPEEHHLVIDAQRRFQLVERGEDCIYCPSIDLMLGSLANAYGSSAIGVLLSGMGNDGVQGLGDIRAKGGKTLVQDRETSLIFGMPGAAIAAGVADNVLPLDLIAPMLTSHCQANNTARHE